MTARQKSIPGGVTPEPELLISNSYPRAILWLSYKFIKLVRGNNDMIREFRKIFGVRY